MKRNRMSSTSSLNRWWFLSLLLLATSMPSITASTLVTQWEGMAANGSSSKPADTSGGAGPSGIIQTADKHIAYYTKAGALIWGPVDSATFLASLGDAVTFDWTAIYDATSGRFYVTLPGKTASQSFYYVAVSKTSNPLTSGSQDWYFYEIDVTEYDPGNHSNRWSADYPGVGVDRQALYVAFKMDQLTGSGPSYLNTQILVLKKADINSGILTVSRLFTPGGDVNEVGGGFVNATRASSLRPVTIRGASDPGNVAYFAETPVLSTNTVRIWVLNDPLHNTNLTSAIVSVPDNVGGLNESAPQPGTNIRLETWSHYTQGYAAWYNGSIWFCQTARNIESGPGLVHYYQVNINNWPASGSPSLGASGVINGGAGEWTFQPAIHANDVGDICIVFTQSSSTTFPTIMYTVRAAGSISFETPSVLKISPSAYIGVTRSTNNARWGDWALVSPDPTDGSFWISHEWAKSSATDNWSTWFGKISIPSTIPAEDAFANRITLTGAPGVTARSNFYASKEPGEPNHAGNSGGRSIWWQWTASAPGILTIDTFGSSFDTLLAVYIGGSVSSLTPIASNDNSGNSSQSRVSFNVVAGNTYQIAVDGANAAQGNVILNWSFDSDGDGMPDQFELAYGLNPNNPSDASVDSDGDGYTNLQEYLAGTDPKDPESALRITDISQAGPDMVITFSSVLGKSYLVERNDTFPLNTWTTVATNVSGHDGTTQVTDNGGFGVPHRTYRVQVLP